MQRLLSLINFIILVISCTLAAEEITTVNPLPIPICSKIQIREDGRPHYSSSCYSTESKVIVEDRRFIRPISNRLIERTCTEQEHKSCYPFLYDNNGNPRSFTPPSPPPGANNPDLPNQPITPPPSPYDKIANNPYFPGMLKNFVENFLPGIFNGFGKSYKDEIYERYQRATPIPQEIINQIKQDQMQMELDRREWIDVDRQRINMLNEMAKGVEGMEFKHIPLNQRPTTLPPGVNKNKVDQLFDPLWQASRTGDFQKGAEELGKLLNHIAQMSQSAKLEDQMTSDYLKAELQRLFVNDQFLMKSFPFTRTPKLRIERNLTDSQGLRIRNTANELSALEANLNSKYINHCLSKPCSEDQNLTQKMSELANFIGDSYRHLKMQDQYPEVSKLNQLHRSIKDWNQNLQTSKDIADFKNQINGIHQQAEELKKYYQQVEENHSFFARATQGPLFEQNPSIQEQSLQFKDCISNFNHCSKTGRIQELNKILDEVENNHQQALNQVEQNIQTHLEKEATLASDIHEVQDLISKLPADSPLQPVLREKLAQLTQEREGVAALLQRERQQQQILLAKGESFRMARSVQSLAPIGEKLLSLPDSRTKSFGQATLVAASESYIENDAETGDTLKSIALDAVDLALSFTPGVSVAKDAYEFITGTNLVTGAELSTLERSFAGFGVLTAGGSHYIKGGIDTLIKVTDKLSSALQSSRSTGEAISSVKNFAHLTSTNGMLFLNKMKYSTFYKEATQEFYEQSARQYFEIEQRLLRHTPQVVEQEFTIGRAVDRTFKKANGEIGVNTSESVLKIHDGNLIADHRYTIGGPNKSGEHGLYGVIGDNQEILRKDALKELSASKNGVLIGDEIFNSTRVRVSKVLDLTDEHVVNNILKIDGNLLTLKGNLNPLSYNIPQMIGNIAKRQGYDAIIVPSAVRGTSSKNIVIISDTLLEAFR